MNGFRMLNELEDYEGEIIFTTAYSYYAIEAIRFSAFDYLMKPVVIEDLQAAVKRLRRQLVIRTKDRLDVLRTALNKSHSQDDRIAVPTGDGLELIQMKNVVRIESSSNYSRIYLYDRQIPSCYATVEGIRGDVAAVSLLSRPQYPPDQSQLCPQIYPRGRRESDHGERR